MLIDSKEKTMKFKLIALAVALAGAILLAACGSDDSSTTTPPSSSAAAEPNGVDRAFAQAMIPHHRSAIEMARVAHERARSGFVRGLAADIIDSQAAEITTLSARDKALAASGVPVGRLDVPEDETGMGHDAQLLEGADAFDRTFVELMIPHHRGAIAMAQAELDGGGDAELRRLATQIITAQQGEIDAMQAQLAGGADGEESMGGGSTTMDAHSGH